MVGQNTHLNPGFDGEGGLVLSDIPILAILAAGRASRFGSVKQLEPVGPGGESLMDYAVFDAIRAGFREIVFVVRPELEAQFHAAIGRRLAGRMPVTYVHQRLDDLPAEQSIPAERMKPWGTAHAVLTLAPVVNAPFAVVNADDYYGLEAFQALGRFFSQLDSTLPPIFAMVGYRLGDTLSAAGSVSRGICRGDGGGWLHQIY
jgi:NDP-sugar pyrophosphorylase family protein